MTAIGLRTSGGRIANAVLVVAGLLALGTALGLYAHLDSIPNWNMAPVDMTVYRDAGLIVRQPPAIHNPLQPWSLYTWAGPHGLPGLRFTYPPFAAMLFDPLSYLGVQTLAHAGFVIDVLALLAVNWIVFRAFGIPRGTRRAGLTLLTSAAVFLTEPVQRVIYLGQIDLLLVLLIVWDLCQPERRWWQGAGVGIAAGIKLTPLIFIPYLLITRRYRQAAVASGTFGLTIAAGFAMLPQDSSRFWLQGLFLRNRAGTVFWNGNQSLLAVISRAGGGQQTTGLWLTAAILTGITGLACAAQLDRAGHRMLGLAACALTSLLISPISWDHHWAWITVFVAVIVGYAVLLSGLARWACVVLAVAVTAIFGTWPTSLWGDLSIYKGWFMGTIWLAPSAGQEEYGWHGMQLVYGNSYVITGMALLIAATIVAIRLTGARAAHSDDQALADLRRLTKA